MSQDVTKHRARHEFLHRALDELVADYMLMAGGRTYNTISDLLTWSHKQTSTPDTKPVPVSSRLNAKRERDMQGQV
jgi:hypothetical protein